MNYMEKDIKENLINFGLTEPESKIYYSALKIDDASVDIISKQSGINRTACYPVLGKLIKLGLVSRAKKKGKTVYKSASPQKILDILNEKRKGVEKIIPQLNSLYEVNRGKPDVSFYEGQEGVKTVLNLILKETKEILVFGDGNSFKRAIPGWTDQYSLRRAKKGIKAKFLLKATPLSISCGKKYKTIKNIKSKYTKYRVLPEAYELEYNGFYVYNNKVALCVFEKEPLAIVIESKIISNLLRSMFNILWNIAEKYNNTLLRD